MPIQNSHHDRHCAGVDLCTFTVEIGIPLRMEGYSVCNEPDPGLLQTLVFSIGFANGHCKYTSAMSSALATI